MRFWSSCWREYYSWLWHSLVCARSCWRITKKSRCTTNFSGHATPSCAHPETGGILVLLTFCLSLLILLFGLSLHSVTNLHARVAEQSRVDVCAVRLMMERKQMLKKLIRLNRLVNISEKALYGVRGLKAFSGPAAVLTGITEATLLRMNHTAASAQDALQSVATIKEYPICEATKFSRSNAWCNITPNAKLAFLRRQALFPDIRGTLQAKNSAKQLAQVTCIGRKQNTQLSLMGSPTLLTSYFRETYAK
jgi:hypothetical protein